jgi:hypothetical protein
MGNGPARGFFQMEPATHDDIWTNYLAYHKPLAELVTALKSSPAAKGSAELENNDLYAAAMARVHYKRAPGALPAAGNLQAMASYWKQYYNTPLGAGTPKQYMDDWRAVFG